MRESLTMLGAVAALWTLGAGAAQARCDLSDAAAVTPPAQADMVARPKEERAHAPAQPQVRREETRIIRTEGCVGHCPPARPSIDAAIPDGALMQKRRIL